MFLGKLLTDYVSIILQDVMVPYNSQTSGLQDYDVPPPDRDFINVRSTSRRPSYDAFRNSAGSRKASLVSELYDTPPSSKRTSEETSEGIYDTPPSSKRASSERTPPPSNRSSASRDSGSNLLSACPPGQLNGTLNLPMVVRRKSGPNPSENCYETPPGSNRSSQERILSVDSMPIYESLSPAISEEHLDVGEPIYDTPPLRNHVQSLSNPASQASLGSAVSNESLLSNTSGLSSTHISQNTSLPDSARSSMDLPSDIYDVPPSAQEGDRSRKQLSMDSGLGFYDSPQKSRPSSAASNTDSLKASHSSFDCKPFSSDKDIKRSKSLENTVDDLYDTPKNNGPKFTWKKAVETTGNSSSLEPSDTYSITPQEARDSVISVTSDSSDENKRLSTSSLDIEQQLAGILLWDDLLLDLDSAVEMLAKRQEEIFKATTKLSSFVNSTWRSRSSLEKTLYEIKASCTLVKSSLQDFVDFSHGAIANAARLPDYQLAGRLQKFVSPLQSTLELVNKSFLRLEEMKWQVSLLSEPIDNSKPDDLSQIALVAKDLMSDVKKAALFIQSNSQTLFKRVARGEIRRSSMSSKPPIGLRLGGNNGGNSSSSSSGQYKSIQQRPLPAVPGRETCQPANCVQSTQDKSKPLMSDNKETLNMDDYAECDELSLKLETEMAQKASMGHCIQDPEYVHVDPRDICTSQSSNSELAWDSSKLCEQNEKDIYKNNQINLNDFGEQTIKTTNSENFNSNINILPVKENPLRNIQDLIQSKPEKVFSVLTNGEITLNSDAVSDLEGSEQDLKTPVNLNTSSDEAKFILPPVESANLTSGPEAVDPNDRQVLVFYIEKMNSHSTLLANAVDAFISVVSNKEPPNVFISHSKFVMVSAHKLVHIGDSIHRNLVNNSLSIDIMRCANHLCDCLKASVTATKVAALQYPSPPAVQEMVDGVVAVSHAAHQLKRVITQAAQQ